MRVEHDRFELLAQVGVAADGAASLEQTVERLLGIVVPAFADLALLDAVSPGSELRRLGVRVAGPRNEELEAALLRRRRIPDASFGMAKAVSGGRSHIIAVNEGHLRALASSDDDLELLRSLRLRSVLFVPLRSRTRILGALAYAIGASGRHYSDSDVRFGEALSSRIALALDNAGLSEMLDELERRLEATLANLAEAVLVRDASGRIVFADPAAAGLLGVSSVEEVTRAAPGELMTRFDVFDEGGRALTIDDLPAYRAQRGERPGGWLVVVGDVVGRGAEAAALTSLSRYTLRAACKLLGDPLKVIAHLKDAVRARSPVATVSVACAVLHEADGEAHAEIVVAGHPPPYLVRSGEPRLIGSFGALLGAYDDGAWRAEGVVLEPGDRLVLYTDGVGDTVGEHERFGQERLTETLRLGQTARQTVDCIDRAVRRFGRGPQGDDRAMLVVERVSPLSAVADEKARASADRR